VDPILFAMLNKRKNYSSCMFWIEPKQKTHWKEVEAILWHKTLEINDRKYFMHYVMSFDAFNNSVEKLFPFLKLKCF
jgi:hypothetical protein